MIAEIISTGDEIITGMVTDTNASWLSSKLLELGIQVSRRETVGDRLEDLTAVIAERSRKADVLFVNGGLGPTSDDNTSKAAAAAAQVNLVRHEEWVLRIRKWHEERRRDMPETNLKQADIPAGAQILDNLCGTACGFFLRINKALCFFTPGVPSEFYSMYEHAIKPYLKKHFACGDTAVKRLFLFGVSESFLQKALNDVPQSDRVVLGYRAAYPLLELKVICHHATGEEAERTLEAVREKVSGWLICEDESNPARLVAQRFGDRRVLIKDYATGGELTRQLSPWCRSLASVSSNEPEALSGDPDRLDQGFDLVLSLTPAKDSGKTVFTIMDMQKPARALRFETELSVTDSARRREAIALETQMLMLRAFKAEGTAHALLHAEQFRLPQLQLGEIALANIGE